MLHKYYHFQFKTVYPCYLHFHSGSQLLAADSEKGEVVVEHHTAGAAVDAFVFENHLEKAAENLFQVVVLESFDSETAEQENWAVVHTLHADCLLQVDM